MCNITFKLAKFAYGKALFYAVSMDIYLLVVKNWKKIVKGSIAYKEILRGRLL